jgi:NAD(P)-dependent dehydrogenase (short-subunit alcohol dehydrogenase family)
MPRFDVDAHVMVVTGAATGLVFAIARACHEAGARVALGVRSRCGARDGGRAAGRASLPLSTPPSR